MSDKATLKLCVLWENELRIASKLIHAVHDLPAETPEDVKDKAARDAFLAATVALWGLTDDSACVLAAGSLSKRYSFTGKPKP